MIRSELPEHSCGGCGSPFPKTASFTRQQFTCEGGEFAGATAVALFVVCPSCEHESIILWSVQL